MRRRVVVLGALAAAGFVGVAWAGRDEGEQARSERRLVLREDFDGRRLDRRRWNTCHWWARGGCTIASNNELEWYLPEQARLRRGRLRLVAERRTVRGSDGRDYPYASGMISSGPRPGRRRAKFAFRYGRAAIRARVPAGRGLWSAFWLLPASRESKPEIDVMEVIGQRPDTVEMHLHWRREDGEVERRGKEWRQPSLRRGWHTFAIDWRPGRLAWLIDGVVRWRVRGRAVPSEPMYLVANLAVGGDWPGPPDATTRFPSALAIDWVKVWS
jgi:beta-glucanase (GH16 family)